MQQYKTVVVDPGHETIEDASTGAMIVPRDVHTWRMGSTWNNSTNILGLVIFSVVTGIAIGIYLKQAIMQCLFGPPSEARGA